VSLEETYGGDGFGASLARLRANERRRRLVILGVALIGLALGTLHWLGLVLGGALVALPAPSIRRGLANGIGLGVLGLLLFAALLVLEGALGPVLATGMVGGLAVAIGLAAPLLGSLVRAAV
jgi:hypothetical protein